MGCTFDCQLQAEEDVEQIQPCSANVTPAVCVTPSQTYLPQHMGPSFIGDADEPMQMGGSDMRASEMKELTQIYQKCQHYYAEHDVDTASSFLPSLDQAINKLRRQGHNPERLSDTLKTAEGLSEQIRTELKDVKDYCKEIGSAGWVLKSDRQGVQVYTRREEATVGVKINSLIEVPFEVMVSVLIELNLHKEFIPFMETSRLEKIVARNCRLGYAVSGVPLLAKRQAFFQGLAYDRLCQNGTVLLYTRSMQDREDLQQLCEYRPDINPRHVQLSYKYFVVQYKPLKEGLGEITIAMNVDSKINFVPFWVLDRLSQDYGQKFLNNIVRISENFIGSKWEQEVNKNPQLFHFLQSRIARFLHNIRSEPEQARRSSTDKDCAPCE